MSRTVEEIAREAIDICNESRKTYEEKTIPILVILAYCFGKMTDKEIKRIKKRAPELYKIFSKYFEKGRAHFNMGICEKCKTQNDSESKFCKNCGNKLN